MNPRLGFVCTGALTTLTALSSPGWAEDESRHSSGGVPHFNHPLVAESPTPDTKLRLDYQFLDEPEADLHTAAIEAEYAFVPWFGVELNIPYTVNDPEREKSQSSLDNIEIALKAATGLPGHDNILLGGGIEFVLPSGNDAEDIGSNNELEIAPFVDFGVKSGPVELVGFLFFEIPTNEDPDERDEVDLKLAYNLALTYIADPSIRFLLELDGESIASGTKEEDVLNLSPGVVVRPLADPGFETGLSVGFPVTDDKEFNTRILWSGFYHF